MAKASVVNEKIPVTTYEVKKVVELKLTFEEAVVLNHILFLYTQDDVLAFSRVRYNFSGKQPRHFMHKNPHLLNGIHDALSGEV